MYKTPNMSIGSKTTCLFFDIIDKILPKEKYKIFNLRIPSHILYRTKLICQYIEDEIEEDFKLENFLMLLYLNFIKNSIRNYNPENIYKLLSKNYYDSKTIVLCNGDEIIKVDRKQTELSMLEITISKSDYDKGVLILEELYELYKKRYSIANILECLWMDFISSYQKGENKRAYHSIMKLLKNTLD